MRTIHMSATWQSGGMIDIPDHETRDAETLARDINNGDWPDWLSDEINSSTAEMTDWEATA